MIISENISVCVGCGTRERKKVGKTAGEMRFFCCGRSFLCFLCGFYFLCSSSRRDYHSRYATQLCLQWNKSSGAHALFPQFSSSNYPTMQNLTQTIVHKVTIRYMVWWWNAKGKQEKQKGSRPFSFKGLQRLLKRVSSSGSICLYASQYLSVTLCHCLSACNPIRPWVFLYIILLLVHYIKLRLCKVKPLPPWV